MAGASLHTVLPLSGFSRWVLLAAGGATCHAGTTICRGWGAPSARPFQPRGTQLSQRAFLLPPPACGVTAHVLADAASVSFTMLYVQDIATISTNSPQPPPPPQPTPPHSSISLLLSFFGVRSLFPHTRVIRHSVDGGEYVH